MRMADYKKHTYFVIITKIFLIFSIYNHANAYTLEMTRIEYRDYPTGQSTRVAAIFNDDSAISVNPNVSSWVVTYMGDEIESTSSWEGWCQEVRGRYDTHLDKWQFDSSFSTTYYMRKNIAPSNLFINSDAPAGTYTSSIITDDGTFTNDLSFDGKLDVPRIDSSTFLFEYNLDRDLTISWKLPGQNQFPEGADMYLSVEDANDWTMLGIFYMPTTLDRITIPNETMALLGNPEWLAVRMTTQTQNRSNRFYSDTVYIQTQNIPVRNDKIAPSIPMLLLD